jgi:hypothetical protein
MGLFGNKESAKDVAVGYEKGFLLKPLDVFTCGMGLYTAMQIENVPDIDEPVILEIIDLDGAKLGEGLEDYCFIATPDVVARMKFEQRRQAGQCDAEGLAAIKLTDARPMDDIENVLGCAVLEHPQAKKALFLHKKLKV